MFDIIEYFDNNNMTNKNKNQLSDFHPRQAQSNRLEVCRVQICVQTDQFDQWHNSTLVAVLNAEIIFTIFKNGVNTLLNVKDDGDEGLTFRFEERCLFFPSVYGLNEDSAGTPI